VLIKIRHFDLLFILIERMTGRLAILAKKKETLTAYRMIYCDGSSSE